MRQNCVINYKGASATQPHRATSDNSGPEERLQASDYCCCWCWGGSSRTYGGLSADPHPAARCGARGAERPRGNHRNSLINCCMTASVRGVMADRCWQTQLPLLLSLICSQKTRWSKALPVAASEGDVLTHTHTYNERNWKINLSFVSCSTLICTSATGGVI